MEDVLMFNKQYYYSTVLEKAGVEIVGLVLFHLHLLLTPLNLIFLSQSISKLLRTRLVLNPVTHIDRAPLMQQKRYHVVMLFKGQRGVCLIFSPLYLVWSQIS
jgi:hypothetical protein